MTNKRTTHPPLVKFLKGFFLTPLVFFVLMSTVMAQDGTLELNSTDTTQSYLLKAGHALCVYMCLYCEPAPTIEPPPDCRLYQSGSVSIETDCDDENAGCDYFRIGPYGSDVTIKFHLDACEGSTAIVEYWDMPFGDPCPWFP